jgi:dUTPase
MTLSHTACLSMLSLQDSNNSVVHSEWRTQHFQFLRAAVVEGSECLDHVGWKWWKKQTPDVPQAQLEIVDIWHFYLSAALMSADGSHDGAAHALLNPLVRKENSLIFDGQTFAFSTMSLLEKIEILIGLATVRRISTPLFDSILKDLGLSWNALSIMYIGKNALNRFRQAHGYAQGTYQKIWAGEEDNVHLLKIMVRANDQEDVLGFVMQELDVAYQTLCGDPS